MSDATKQPAAFYYKPPRHVRAWYAAWRWLGFGLPYVPRDQLHNGLTPDPITTNVRMSFSWGDRIRILLTGRGTLQLLTWTNAEVAHAKSDSDFRVPMPFTRD